VKCSATPGAIRRPPPRLGEHTVEVLTDLGVPADEIRRLRGEGVI
jgi:alpha-methylacyl-CoA racemase